jgi:5-methylcytosine-specific restriction enzyme A
MRIPAAVREAVHGRSLGRCEIGLAYCCAGAADQIHHRITVKSGGRKGSAVDKHNRLSNVMHTCYRCHFDVTYPTAERYAQGLCLREWQDPSAEPVLRRGVSVLLYDDGTFAPAEAVSV